MKPKVYRQGDVFIRRITEIPTNGVAREGAQLLALGEVTGHCHAVDNRQAQLYDIEDGILTNETPGAKTYMQVGEAGAEVTHQEHDTVFLEQGSYEVSIQQEYSPEAIRRVAD